MTNFNVRLQIGDLAGTRFEELEALVDTGATFSAAPRELLDRLGVRPARRQRFRIANGELVEHDVGDALMRLEGMEGTTRIIFNEPGEPALLGAVTLEEFLLSVDPVGQRLVPIVGLLVSFYDP